MTRITEEKLRNLAALASVVSATVRNFQAEEVMGAVLDRLTDLGMTGGSIHLREGDELVMAASMNLNPQTAEGLQRVPLGAKRFASEVMRRNRPTLWEDLPSEEFPTSAELIEREKLLSVVGIPIPGPHGPVGVLSVGTAGPEPITDEQIVMLVALTNQVGVALENNRLYQDLQRHKDNLEALVQERTDQLQLAQDQLVKRERLATLGQLAGSLGHELRGPLVNLRMVLSLLNEADAETRADLVARMDRELTRCNSVINDLLDYTRSREPERIPTSLSAILHQAVKVLGKQPGLSAMVDAEDVERVSLDPDQVLRTFENLLGNAAEAVQGVGKVRIRLRSVDGFQEVRVEDSGPGVPEDMRQRVFEPLITTRRGGTGLGLAVCKRTVDAHGGSIWVEPSADLGGACFVVRFPAG